MRHHNTVLHGILQYVPWPAFERLVAAHAADAGVRQLPTRSQFIALLFAQLAGAVSLREIEAALASQSTRLYHLGARPIRRSTLADANAKRPAAVFTGLFAALLAVAQRGLRRAVGEAVYLIDSTSIRLSELSAAWARFSAASCGAKLHVIYDAAAGRPIYAVVSTGKVNDIAAAKTMPIEPGATYVFDLAYYDYGFWAKLGAACCRIVTRFKRNTPLTLIEELPLPPGSAILSDRIGFLPERQASSRRNPMSHAVREVRVRTETGQVLRLLSNDLDAPAAEIAALYKRRWDIELFFRWIKQTLKITRFLGTSENAIRTQVAVALIAFLLLKLAHAAQKAVASLLAFTRLVRANLMHRRHLHHLLDPPPPISHDNSQFSLQWSPP